MNRGERSRTWKIHGRLCNISTQANSFFGTHVTKAVPLSNNFKSIERLKSININDGIGPQLSFFVGNVDGLKGDGIDVFDLIKH